MRRLLSFLAITLVFLPTLAVSAHSPEQRAGAPAAPVHKLKTVAFGDSNTQDFNPGIVNWYERLGALTDSNPIQLQSHSQVFSYRLILDNQSVGATSMAPTTLNGQNAQYDINGALRKVGHVHLGFVMLGTNDAYRGVTVSTFIASYQAFISAVKASGKVERLEVLSVPPMTTPYNCISNCYPFPNNPQIDRVVPYNQQLASISSYCSSIGYQCDFIDSSSLIPLNATYIDPSTGIHLLNPAQIAIANNVNNHLHGVPLPPGE